MLLTAQLSKLSTHVVVAPAETAEHSRASTVDGVAPLVSSCHGAMKNVLMACTHGDSMYTMPDIFVVAAGCKLNDISDENVIDVEQFVMVASDANPVRTVLHIGVIVGV